MDLRREISFGDLFRRPEKASLSGADMPGGLTPGHGPSVHPAVGSDMSGGLTPGHGSSGHTDGAPGPEPTVGPAPENPLPASPPALPSLPTLPSLDTAGGLTPGQGQNVQPEPAAPDVAPPQVAAEEAAAAPPSAGLLKKEISLSGLFRRGGGAPDEAKPAKPPKPPRQEKQPKQPKEKQPKEPKQPKAQRAPKAAPPLAQVPLMRAFNLLPKDDSRAKRTGSNTGVIAVVVGAVLVVAALGALYFQSSAAVSHKQSQVTELQAKLAAINVKPETPREKIAPQLQTEQSGRTTALATALSGRIAWDRILREISLVLPDDISLTQVQTTSLAAADATQPSVTQIEFDGFAPTQASVGLMLSRLALIPEVASVELVRSDGSANSANQTGPIFQVHVTLKPGIATAGASPGGTA